MSERELGELDRGFQEFRKLSGEQRRSETAKKLVQVPLDLFFQRDLPEGLRGGDGDRNPVPGQTARDDMDVVIADASAEWIGRTWFDVVDKPARVHIEVAAFGEWRKQKVVNELTSLQRSIDTARSQCEKCWTALALIGNEWDGAARNIGRCLHDYYHQRSLVRGAAPPPYPYSWPFVDAVVLPGMYLMKHDFFEEVDGRLPNQDQYATWKAWPFLVAYPFSTAGTLGYLRPLALCRAFMRRTLRRLVPPHENTNLWSSSAERLEVEGPPTTEAEDQAWLEDNKYVCLQDGAPEMLWHWDVRSWRAIRRTDPVCSDHVPYTFRAEPKNERPT